MLLQELVPSTIRVSPFAYYIYTISSFIVALGMPALNIFTVSLLHLKPTTQKEKEIPNAVMYLGIRKENGN